MKPRLVLLLALFPSLLMAQGLPCDGVTGILQAFQRHPVVAIGEIHSIQQSSDFYDSLLRNRDFQQQVRNIVIEFASRRSQPILDRYVDGEDIPPGELRQIWQNTTKVFAFESPIYAHFLATVRDVNAHLAAPARLRVLAGDAPIDWSTITTHAQWESFQPNNRSFAHVIESEVLNKGARALVILGNGHLMKNTNPHVEPDTTMLVEHAHPGSMYVVMMSVEKPPQGNVPPPPALLPWPAVPLSDGRKVITGSYSDAILYLGAAPIPAPPDWEQLQRDPSNVRELIRRARIEWGCNFSLDRFRKGQAPCPSH